MKANHNAAYKLKSSNIAVSNGSKILKWKQITTNTLESDLIDCCFQWFKDTKMKANHNREWEQLTKLTAVSNGSKILKWKQITTADEEALSEWKLFPMVQRY